ncbi:glucan biosynthesis protein [Luteimonas sp. 3794]|uniref:glucan biosynthesis protein n=1 Tax=Luteimonas sp. 3794 TaxID=2817730 RepID=UPI00286075CA|nr:glucan biosynthesis protein [Luteimonas sp. 3794]MDR6991728.1 glucans biosynthesis protein [Luteimonas sp. 3794]
MAAPLLGGWWPAFAAAAQGATSAPFDEATVVSLARALAANAHAAPDVSLPAALAGADYDQYRNFRYRPEQALWRELPGVEFQAQFFHRGFLFKPRVEIHVVADGQAREVPFSTALFDYSPNPTPALDETTGFAGFRLHAPLNSRDYFDELCVFLGASYFRAVGKGLAYGLSARGVALGSGDPEPEEFPAFRAFWLHRPDAGDTAILVDALLDGPSVAGAYRFRIQPGDDTIFEIDAHLFPRVDLAHAGVAPLTSMYQFDAADRVGVDDYRPSVHDSDGLGLWTGTDEQVWRPLHNPASIQHSGFQDRSPRGFGLMQRKRAFDDFEDAEAGYERRPSAWVEPLDDWGRGEVHLVEIPTADEYQDNIVAFWRPAQPLEAGSESRWRYRLHWTQSTLWKPELAHVAATRIGARPGGDRSIRLVVIDFEGGLAEEVPQLEVMASTGRVSNPVVHTRPGGGWRVAFEFAPAGSESSDLRARLHSGGKAAAETWVYRWSA